MTRWLAAAKVALGVPDKTDTTDKTPSCYRPTQSIDTDPKPNLAQNGVLSHLSVLSGGGKADFGDGEGVQSSPSLHDPDALKMEFEERAAVLEYDGGHSRQEAERLARAEIFGANIEKGEAQ